MPSGEQEKRLRDWFITVHQGADCYEKVFDICEATNTTFWAGITHDKDVETTQDGEVVPAPIHRHIAICLKNGCTFTAMQKRFPGAHIENPLDIKGSVKYLLHRTAKSLGKHQYEPTEIVTEYPQRVKAILEEKEAFEPFIEADWEKYIAQGVTNEWVFAKRFGVKALGEYGRPFLGLVAYMRTHQHALDDVKQVMNEEAQKEGGLPF